jgi:hypothetical protein
LFKAKDLLYLSSWDYNTGNKEDDLVTKNLMRRLLDSSAMSLCSPLAFGFDETVLFNSFQVDNVDNKNTKKKNDNDENIENKFEVVDDTELLAKKFKKVFKIIAKLVSCVKCQKCRLHGKIAIHGIGAALKILLTSLPTSNSSPVSSYTIKTSSSSSSSSSTTTTTTTTTSENSNANNNHQLNDDGNNNDDNKKKLSNKSNLQNIITTVSDNS